MDGQPPQAHFDADPIVLPGGRTVCVRAYPDGSIRFRVDGLPYVLTEAYLSGDSETDGAILTISPGRQGSKAAHNYVESLKKNSG
ncbi:hypothetical protein AB0387_00405 [Streptomyces sp. NPDC089173]|uniref:hypothetical protein n=1 Tax=Streptomyces sp. NPDC089173 TaxID=3154965 RepID=UPI0034500A77